MKTMRIVIIGGAGMLGHKMFQVLRERFPGTICTTLEDVKRPPFDKVELLQGDDVIRGVDVMDFDKLHNVLRDLRPDFIVNCVGIVKQRQESRMAIPSITINSLLPHKLAAFAAGWGGRVIHPSTDCVFDGKRGGYSEADDSTAEDLYGKSKFLGEIHCDNGLTLRTSIIGRELVEHRSLLDWFLSQQGAIPCATLRQAWCWVWPSRPGFERWHWGEPVWLRSRSTPRAAQMVQRLRPRPRRPTMHPSWLPLQPSASMKERR